MYMTVGAETGTCASHFSRFCETGTAVDSYDLMFALLLCAIRRLYLLIKTATIKILSKTIQQSTYPHFLVQYLYVGFNKNENDQSPPLEKKIGQQQKNNQLISYCTQRHKRRWCATQPQCCCYGHLLCYNV